jgi:hypothetical protein
LAELQRQGRRVAVSDTNLEVEKLRAEIEAQKLQADVDKARISSRYQLAIAFLGTFLVSVIGSYLVFVENTAKNEQAFDGGHRDFVAKFVEIAIDDDIERRQRLARYFASVTLDPVQKDRWIEYADYVEELIKSNPAEIAELRANLPNADAAERSAIEARIQFLEKQLGATRARHRATAARKRRSLPGCADRDERRLQPSARRFPRSLAVHRSP